MNCQEDDGVTNEWMELSESKEDRYRHYALCVVDCDEESSAGNTSDAENKSAMPAVRKLIEKPKAAMNFVLKGQHDGDDDGVDETTIDSFSQRRKIFENVFDIPLQQLKQKCDPSFEPRFYYRKEEKESKVIDEQEKKENGKDDEDPLYDPELDDRDSNWVHDNLRMNVSSGQIPSDAILSCPCCFLSVCLDCQRHIRYKNQYRSLSAINCRVDESQVLAACDQSKESSGALKAYYATRCSDCGTQVGVLDPDQVYHFFNVLPSHS